MTDWTKSILNDLRIIADRTENDITRRLRETIDSARIHITELETERDEQHRQIEDQAKQLRTVFAIMDGQSKTIAALRSGRDRWAQGGYVPADHDDQDATVAYRAIQADIDANRMPRLTVHDLNTAPVGSVVKVSREPNGRTKRTDGMWWRRAGHYGTPSEDMIKHGWADATLITPEDKR